MTAPLAVGWGPGVSDDSWIPAGSPPVLPGPRDFEIFISSPFLALEHQTVQVPLRDLVQHAYNRAPPPHSPDKLLLHLSPSLSFSLDAFVRLAGAP